MIESLEPHFRMIAKAITEGHVTPLLGAGVNLCGRPPELAWTEGCEYLPSSPELAAFLADEWGYPDDEARDLVRVSEYASVMLGDAPLYEKLHDLFDADYPPTQLHEFLAQLPALLRERSPKPRYQLILTTNYDDTLERAFDAASEPYHLVSYIATGDHRGKFLHWPTGKDPRIIEKANEYSDISLEERSVILKIHGIVDRENKERDSFVITEDHYIDYLTRSTNVSELLPATLVARLTRSHILFLGYGMRDWNLRVLFHRIWGERELTWNSWAVQKSTGVLDEKFWRKRNVDILAVALEEYTAGLSEQVRRPLVGNEGSR
jgi:hypothetical protein